MKDDDQTPETVNVLHFESTESRASSSTEFKMYTEEDILNAAKAAYFADSEIPLEKKEKEWKTDNLLRTMYLRRTRAIMISLGLIKG